MNEYLQMIPSPNRERCAQLWWDNEERFQHARGSSHNHQAWPGGYVDHVTDVMRIACALYPSLQTIRTVPFVLADALLVLFLHDLEKPWREVYHFATKLEKRRFRATKIAEYGIELTPAQENALRYVEGEGDEYRPDARVMNELAAFCHMCDVASARIWHSVRGG